MLLGPLWLSWRLVARTLRGVKVERQIPRGVCAGDPLVVKVEVCNTRRRLGSWAVVVEGSDPAGNSFGTLDRRDLSARDLLLLYSRTKKAASVFTAVGCRSAASTVSTSRLSRPVSPSAFFRRTVRIGAPDLLVIYPRLGRLTQRVVLAAARVVRGNASTRDPSRSHVGRFLRRASLAQRRFAAIYPLAEHGAPWRLGRSPIRAASQSRFGRARGPVAAEIAAAGRSGKRRTGGELRGNRDCRGVSPRRRRHVDRHQHGRRRRHPRRRFGAARATCPWTTWRLPKPRATITCRSCSNGALAAMAPGTETVAGDDANDRPDGPRTIPGAGRQLPAAADRPIGSRGQYFRSVVEPFFRAGRTLL